MDNQPLYDNAWEPPLSPPLPKGGAWGGPRRRTFVLVGVAVFVVALLVVGMIFFFSRRATQRSVKEAAQQAASQVSGQECDAAIDRQACLDRLKAEAMGGQGKVGACKDLAADLKDACLWQAANASMDASACEGLSTQESKDACADLQYRAQATNGLKIDACANIKDEASRVSCESFFFTGLTIDQCNQMNRPADVCDGLSKKQAAIAARNPDFCKEIALELIRIDCLDIVGSGDRDGDGLDAYTEAKYGSSDTNVDSDGDGYQDADEVRSGYSPAGPGRL
ncbi:hypothetical protein HYV73_01510 [Candidatus Uhrbacteria bacterium]|nr:hypothetical protein [Candidatus Uhrbacteria bacterium]